MTMDWIRKLKRALRPNAPTDARGRRLVAVIECLLNQNARDAGAAEFVALNGAVVDLCREHGVGLLQMPCPEMACLGLARAREPGQSIGAAMDCAAGRDTCARIGADVAERLQAYARGGYEVLAVLGGNPASPGCAVHVGENGLLPASGALMLCLQRDLRRRGLEIPFRGLRDFDAKLLADDLRWLKGLFGAPAPP